MANTLYWGYFYDNGSAGNDRVIFMNSSYNSADMPGDTKIATEKGLKSLYSASNLSSTNTMCIKQTQMQRNTTNTLRMVKLHDMTLSQLYTHLKNYTNDTSQHGMGYSKNTMVSICSDTIDGVSSAKLVTASNVIPFLPNTNVSCQYIYDVYIDSNANAANKCHIETSIDLLTNGGGPYSRETPIGYLGYVTTYFTAYKLTATTAQFTTLKTAITNSVTYCTSYGYGYGYSYASDAVYGYFSYSFGLAATHNFFNGPNIPHTWSPSFTSPDAALNVSTLLSLAGSNWMDNIFYPNAAFIEKIHYNYWNNHTIPADRTEDRTSADSAYTTTQQQYMGNVFYIRKDTTDSKGQYSDSVGWSRITINKVYYQYCLIPYYIYFANAVGSIITNPYGFDISIPTKQVTCKSTSTLAPTSGTSVDITCKSTFDENGINTTTQNTDLTNFQLYGC